MSDEMKCDFGNEFAPWQSGAAFNAYWTYTYVNNSAFYAMIPAVYRPFMQRFVQNWLWWNDGWVPYFHDQDKGILSTRLATALVSKISKKVVGARVLFKNVGLTNDKVGVNDSHKSIVKWADETNFDKAVKLAAKYAAAGGTSLLKLNKDLDNNLWTEAVRFDRFLPSIDAATGKICEVQCFLYTEIEYTKGKQDQFAQAYNLIERRYFGDYTRATGEILKNTPLVEYGVFRGTGSVTQGQFVLSGNGKSEKVLWKNVPTNVRQSILQSYGAFKFNCPIPLPFDKHLGCELMTWTEGISGLPGLPFGESVLSNVIPFLMEYDYWASCIGTDMYLGRGRVLTPQGIGSGKDARGIAPSFNAGLDSMMYQKIPYLNPDDQKPVPIQFDLRADSWQKIRNTLVESVAINIGLSPSTVAAFLNDSSARTAREVSTEENETANYVADTRAIIETPINRILRLVQLYYRLEDSVVVRWSQSGLSNPFMMTEMMTQQFNAGLVSLKDAVGNLNPDDDEEQIVIRAQAAKTDWSERQLGSQVVEDSDSFFDET